MITNTSNFERALSYEHSRQSVADELYRRLGASEIKRHGWDTWTGRDFQRKDIDVSIRIGGRWINISEKFSSKDSGGMFVEYTSGGRRGWSLTCEADRIMNITPTTYYEIEAEEFVELAHELRHILAVEISSLESGKEGKIYVNKPVNFKGKQVQLKTTLLRLDDHNSSGKSWSNVGGYISWDILRDFGVKFLRKSL